MSGIIGHSVYAVLGMQAAAERGIPLAYLIHRQFSSYLAGAYLGSDVQIVPAVTCVATGKGYGCCGMKIERCPETGGAVEAWRLQHDGHEYSGAEISAKFYGRAHVIFGFAKADDHLAIGWVRLADYAAAAVEDTFDLFPPSERTVAYVLGWLVHVVSDSLIKSFQPGITLHLVDGKYTPKNRPLQDVYCCHEVGVKRLGLHWDAVLRDCAELAWEPAQLHYMRIGERRGRLGQLFPGGWLPERSLAEAVLQENRRHFRSYSLEELNAVRLRDGECSAEIRRSTGLDYAGIVAACERAGYRNALRQMGEQVALMFARVTEKSPRLARLPAKGFPPWSRTL